MKTINTKLNKLVNDIIKRIDECNSLRSNEDKYFNDDMEFSTNIQIGRDGNILIWICGYNIRFEYTTKKKDKSIEIQKWTDERGWICVGGISFK